MPADHCQPPQLQGNNPLSMGASSGNAHSEAYRESVAPNKVTDRAMTPGQASSVAVFPGH
jgi:hypothetical protein